MSDFVQRRWTKLPPKPINPPTRRSKTACQISTIFLRRIMGRVLFGVKALAAQLVILGCKRVANAKAPQQ
jgi:hypothetical protein